MAYKVAIDAGHGSNTAGKRTPDGYREHYINVKCANYFDIAMKRCGIETVRIAWDDTISTDDVDVALSTRQKQIKNAGCNISVSWHANAYGNGSTYNSARGIETLIHNNASKVGDSRNLANKVQTLLIRGTTQKNRGVKTSNLAMCNCTAMGTKASILIEIGFMTNQYEANLMKTDAFCKECAEEAAKGVCEYLGVTYKTNDSATSIVSSKKYVYNGLDYSSVFDSTYYSNKYDDLKSAFGANASKLFEHFINFGMKEKRQAIESFNVTVYKNRYIDLQKAFGEDLPSYYKHYVEFGKKEGRSAV